MSRSKGISATTSMRTAEQAYYTATHNPEPGQPPPRRPAHWPEDGSEPVHVGSEPWCFSNSIHKDTMLMQNAKLEPGEENYYSKLLEKLHPPEDKVE